MTCSNFDCVFSCFDRKGIQSDDACAKCILVGHMGVIYLAKTNSGCSLNERKVHCPLQYLQEGGGERCHSTKL